MMGDVAQARRRASPSSPAKAGPAQKHRNMKCEKQQFTARQQLLMIYALKFLAAMGYFLVSLTLSLYLTDEHGFGDANAGSLYGVLGMLISLYTFPVGWFIDRFGIKRSLVYGALLVTLSRIALALLTDSALVVTVLCTTLPLGEAFAVPSLSAAVGTLAQRASRAAAASEVGMAGDERAAVKSAYGTFYAMMNVGLVCCGPLVDGLRAAVHRPYRHACWISALCGALMLALAWQMTVDDAAGAESETGDVEQQRAFLLRESESASKLGGPAEGDETRGTTLTSTDADTDLLSKRRRRGFFFLTILLIGVRALFRHLDATFPKYFLRAQGPAAPFGLVYSLEPLLIIILVPLFSSDAPSSASSGSHSSDNRTSWLMRLPCGSWLQVLLVRVRALTSLEAITLGCYVGTAAPFVLALSSAWWAPPVFVATIALGEALWAPRFYMYTHEIAPEKEVCSFLVCCCFDQVLRVNSKFPTPVLSLNL